MDPDAAITQEMKEIEELLEKENTTIDADMASRLASLDAKLDNLKKLEIETEHNIEKALGEIEGEA